MDSTTFKRILAQNLAKQLAERGFQKHGLKGTKKEPTPKPENGSTKSANQSER